MRKGFFGGATTVLISTGIILVIVLVGLITFGISVELEKGRQMAGLSNPGEFDPNSLPAPAAGILKYELGRSQGFGRSQESGRPLDCEGVLFSVAKNGTRFVRESGGGRYYGAEVDNMFGIYTIGYGHLVRVENSSLDTHTYRKLKHALYHCDGVYTRSGLRIALNSAENKPA
jgi:hypothetical protein